MMTLDRLAWHLKLEIVRCCPSVNDEILYFFIRICIHLIKSFLKPYFSSDVFKNRWLTKSKAFSISSVIRNIFIFKLSDISRISEISLPPSLMNFPLTFRY